jgi:hypothetical protein
MWLSNKYKFVKVWINNPQQYKVMDKDGGRWEE